MRINMITGCWVCMAHCGVSGGDVLSYQMRAHGQNFVEAAKSLDAWDGNTRDSRHFRRRPLPFPAREALEILDAEANLVAVAACNIARGVTLSNADMSRVVQAAHRISVIREACK